MIFTIDRIIATGAHSINKELNKDRNRVRDLSFSHPEALAHQMVKEEASIRHGGIEPEDISETTFDDHPEVDLFEYLY